MDYVLIITVSCMVLGALYFYKKKFFSNLQTQSLLVIMVAEQELAQIEINCQFVNEIIDGHHSPVSRKTKQKVKTAFEEWQQLQKSLFYTASAERIKVRENYINEGKLHDIFKFEYIDKNPHGDSMRQKNLTLFMENVFTEPFPSTHDMKDFAVSAQLNDIFILHGITPEESKQFLVHEKNHFVNHKMVQGIIQLDIYKLTA